MPRFDGWPKYRRFGRCQFGKSLQFPRELEDAPASVALGFVGNEISIACRTAGDVTERDREGQRSVPPTPGLTLTPPLRRNSFCPSLSFSVLLCDGFFVVPFRWRRIVGGCHREKGVTERRGRGVIQKIAECVVAFVVAIRIVVIVARADARLVRDRSSGVP